MRDRLLQSRLVLLGVGFFLLITFPLLSIANKPKSIGGVPLLFVYFMTVWLVFIIAYFLVIELRKKKKG
jgi:hypothetical protein